MYNLISYIKQGVLVISLLAISTLFAEATSSVAKNNGRGIFVAVGAGGAAYSEDGIAWNKGNDTRPHVWESVAYGNGTFVAVTYNGIMYSTDGVNWLESYGMDENVNWSVIGYGKGAFVAASADGPIAYSHTGQKWYNGELPRRGSWCSFGYCDGTFLMAEMGVINGGIYSSDGIEWHETRTPFLPVPFGGGLLFSTGKEFVIIGDGKIAFSKNAVDWKVSPMTPSSFDGTPAFGIDKFVAVSDHSNKCTYYSHDGIKWETGNPLPVKGDWKAAEKGGWRVIFGGDRFLAVADNNCLYSSDGKTWHLSDKLPMENCSVVYGEIR